MLKNKCVLSVVFAIPKILLYILVYIVSINMIFFTNFCRILRAPFLIREDPLSPHIIIEFKGNDPHIGEKGIFVNNSFTLVFSSIS